MQDQVYVIRTTKYLENDLIVKTLSAHQGKVSYLARGGQRSKKRFGGGVLETGNLITLEYKAGRREDSLGTLNEAKVLDGYEDIRTNYDNIEMVFYFFKLIEKIEWSEPEYEKLFSLIGNSMDEIKTKSSLTSIKFLFDVKILYLQGMLPINEVTLPWLKLKMSECSQIDEKSKDFIQYIKFNQHLMKELCP